VENFLTSCGTISFSRRTLLRGVSCTVRPALGFEKSLSRIKTARA